jgi:regulation of enolase protein 1 (concanavalin A-like superfamily)
MFASSILSLAIALIGQHRLDPDLLPGTWENVNPDRATMGMTLIFGADGRFRSIPKGDGIEFPGTYTMNGYTVTIEPGGFKIMITELDENRLVVDGLNGVNEYKRKEAMMARGVPKTGGFRFGAAPTPKSRLGATPKAPGKWVVVKSEKGDFSVEMPEQLVNHASLIGGGFETQTMSFQNRSMELIVTAIYGPTEVPVDNMSKVLAEIRDRSVGRYGKDLKVITEKPVRVGGLVGQEFVISFDRMGIGTMTIRGRVCAQGKSAYALLAMPIAKGQSLGSDAQKFLESFALKSHSAGDMASAKPAVRSASRAAAKKSAAMLPRAWGIEFDPDADVKIRTSGFSLTMEIPGTAHVLAPERDKMNAPRIVAPVRGDFVASVQVSGAFHPEKKSTVKGLSSRQAGGLIIWKDAKNYLVFQRRATADDGKIANQAVLEELVDGGKGVTHRQPSPEATTYLRLERGGGRVTASFSEDGKEWKSLKPVETSWAEGELQVGIVAVNTSTGAHSARFDGYTLKAK